MSNYFTCVNHISFNRLSTDDGSTGDKAVAEILQNIQGKFHAQAYTSVGKKLSFTFDVSNNLVKVDVESNNEVQAWLKFHNRDVPEDIVVKERNLSDTCQDNSTSNVENVVQLLSDYDNTEERNDNFVHFLFKNNKAE